ncbi:hypothetical protein DYB35_008920 [Aphanomyces astaci]|uniref:Proteasome assembly chaperone 1 n=1 Tax=Aphanomyces astaci TaxID=112090 RepID=A0A418D348_APHAT|nr:hypothetical protein DYB35_008920 [Aphanomyces astaci]
MATPLADAVIVGYCDLSAAGLRLLHHVSIDDTHVVEETVYVHGLPLLVRNFVHPDTKRPHVSILVVPEPVAADDCTLFCAEIVDLLQGSKQVLVLSSLNLPMSSDQEKCVYWSQVHATTPLNLPDLDFEPIPENSRWTIKDQFLSTLLQFLHVEYLPVTLVVVRGYKFSTSRDDDGTAEILVKLGHAAPLVIQALNMASKVAFDLHAAAAMTNHLSTATSAPFSNLSLLYN